MARSCMRRRSLNRAVRPRRRARRHCAPSTKRRNRRAALSCQKGAMITPEFLAILCCPETHQPLALAEASLLERLNSQIAGETLLNRGGQIVREKLDAGLVRSDKQYLYPVRRE